MVPIKTPLSLSLLLLTGVYGWGAPIALHPENPHYFKWKGKPELLITSGEHYGAVVNLDFEYRKYLDTLAKDGLNLTRIFTGSYREPEGAFQIAQNTLAPKAGRFICPWARSGEPGASDGGNKFDLEKWDEAYFQRLKDFVAQAGQRGIIVELTLFCPMYEEAQWLLSPMNAVNNVNGLGKIDRNDVHTLDKSGGLLAVQEALVRRMVTELREAENLCYEICNEPYFGGVTMGWQHRIADILTDAEKEFAEPHLITQNIANGSEEILNPHPAVSVFNFHYANPPDAVARNYGLNKLIGDNETGFRGTADDPYRREAWEFLLAGGGLFNHLDYSFTAGHEDGTFQYPPTQPGGGNPGFRRQLKVLKDFLGGFEFIKMKPARELVQGALPKEASCQILAESGRQVAAYFHGAPKFDFAMDLPAGTWRIQWMEVISGAYRDPLLLRHPGGPARFEVPADGKEWALKATRDKN